MNVLVIGDPHFKVSNVKETEMMTNEIIKVAKEKKPHMIVVLGDILDTHEQINMLAYNNAINLLRQLQDLAPLYVLIGNHDRKNNQVFLTNEHIFTALEWWNNTTIVYTTIRVVKDNYTFIMVPYVPTGKFEQALNLVTWKDADIIFAHQEFKGAQLGPKKSIHGDVWDMNNPYVISGHIHDYCQLQPNLLYLGTPIQHKHYDSNNKCIIMVDCITKTHHKIELNVRRKKIIHLLVSDINKYELDETIDAKIVITCKSTDIKMLSKHAKIEQWKLKGHKVFYKNITKKIKPDSLTNKQFIINDDNFIDLLHCNIKDQPSLLNLYNELFQ